MLKLLQCRRGWLCSVWRNQIDNMRHYYSARNGSDEEKKARKRQRAVRKGLIDAAVEAEE